MQPFKSAGKLQYLSVQTIIYVFFLIDLFLFQEEQYQTELTVLRKRLEELENSQQLQLKELIPSLIQYRTSLHSPPQDIMSNL